jgi:hypothetical protein
MPLILRSIPPTLARERPARPFPRSTAFSGILRSSFKSRKRRRREHVVDAELSARGGSMKKLYDVLRTDERWRERCQALALVVLIIALGLFAGTAFSA